MPLATDITIPAILAPRPIAGHWQIWYLYQLIHMIQLPLWSQYHYKIPVHYDTCTIYSGSSIMSVLNTGDSTSHLNTCHQDEVMIYICGLRLIDWLIGWLLCGQVALSLYNGMDSIISILIICLLIVIAALVPVFAVLEVQLHHQYLDHMSADCHCGTRTCVCCTWGTVTQVFMENLHKKWNLCVAAH